MSKQYNPRYDTKVQPFNSGVVRKWINSQNLKEITQWLNEGEPHKRLIKEAISQAAIGDWLEGLKMLFEKDWISLDSKVNSLLSHIRFCEKDDIWLFVRDIVFSDKKLIKKYSFNLFWDAKTHHKAHLFDERKVDFTHEKASSLLTHYLFPSGSHVEETREKHKEEIDFLLSKSVLFIPYDLPWMMNFENASYVVETFKKHGGGSILKTKEDLFVFSCAAGVYYQAAINHAMFNKKSDAEINDLIEERNFMLTFLLSKNVSMEMDLTPKMLEKNMWINRMLEENFGDICGITRYSISYGGLKLKYFSRNHINENDLPEKQTIKLSWYWIGGDMSEYADHYREKYAMSPTDKQYAETQFADLVRSLDV